MAKQKIEQKKEIEKYMDEARLDTEQRARDTRDYEIMLMDFIRKEFEGI